MKAKVVLTEHNIDFFFDLFEKENYKYGESQEQSSYPNSTQKKEASDMFKHTNAILYLDLDSEEKLYTIYSKFIMGDNFIEFKQVLTMG